MDDQLCHAQQQAFDSLLEVLPLGNVFVLYGSSGSGKTTILRKIHHQVQSVFLNMKDFIDAMQDRNPLALEETFEQMVMDALQANEIVIVDDLHLINNVVCCGGAYPRLRFLDAPLTALTTYAVEAQKKLIFGDDYGAPEPVRDRAFSASIGRFNAVDYAFLCSLYLAPEQAELLDYDKVFRFAPRVNAHQLRNVCTWFRYSEAALDTERFVEYLRSHHMASNVHLSDVQAVDMRELKGVDEVIQSLEANIILPLENDQLATELNLKPKRGVLLAGPPGTGKTTIGRALAHRLKSKFFLIDGTFISGTGAFYGRIHEVFEAAKNNAPSIIFIDDSDAIFESGEELGLYRYLLTMLDGLESESAKSVCVMMTAMDIGNLPPALIRSGRIELWLEMRLPDADARRDILSGQLSSLPPELSEADLPQLIQATEGFTGADLKRMVEDSKTLFAFDKANGAALQTATEYHLRAIEGVRTNKERYAEAEARARQQRAMGARARALPYGFSMAGSYMFSQSEPYSD
jgi:ATP-dependent 26S proteasome regulatory subunit